MNLYLHGWVRKIMQDKPVRQWNIAVPYGRNVPNEDSSGIGSFTFNLRLPEQYAAAEIELISTNPLSIIILTSN
ncbi:MAG: hypothetical protein O7D95_04305 [Betaproteobacteria bacterium]|nr:hypothetical protein [Betaproteobacteria bacterium]